MRRETHLPPIMLAGQTRRGHRRGVARRSGGAKRRRGVRTQEPAARARKGLARRALNSRRVFTVEQRDALREHLLRLAEEDERVVAGAAVGSLAVDGGGD